MDEENTYIRSNTMEQNNPPQTDESQSNQGRYEWLKTIIFFGAVLLITILAIRIITPFIFTEYVPDIVGLESTTEQTESTGDTTDAEEVMPAESLENDSSGEEMSEGEAETADGESTDEADESAAETEEAVDPVPTEEATSSKNDEPEEESAEPEYSTYIVRPGDTLTSIAKAYNLTVEELIAANELINPNLLKAGQELRIPE